MTGKAFLDTNVFLYLYSQQNPAKHAQAKLLINELSREQNLLVSTQVIQEFYSAGSQRLKLQRDLLVQAVSRMLKFPIVINGPDEIRSALSNEQRYQISFWDALILAAAESGGAGVLYTEDLNHGQFYGSVLVQNPFTSPQS